MRWKMLVKAVVFIFIFSILFSYLSGVFTFPADGRNYQWIRGFYEEPDDSLDAVYVGSSACYAFWNPMIAWEEYGIAVYPYVSNAQPFVSAEYLIREVRKTQPDALIIVNTNTLSDDAIKVRNFHCLLDYMPFSLNKMQLTAYLAGLGDLDFKEKLSLFVPLYRYHVRWDQLRPEDFHYQLEGYKGASHYTGYLKEQEDVSERYLFTEQMQPPEAYVINAVDSLMDYCREEQIDILFVTVPRASNRVLQEKINYINATLEDNGFPVLNLMGKTDEIGLDLQQDFYNEGHTNVHGSVKFTQYLSEYLIQTYGWEDKRGDPRYDSWTEGQQRYADILWENLLDIEMDNDYRTQELEAPEGLQAIYGDEGTSLTWEAVEGADGYIVYSKVLNDVWNLLDFTDETAYTDALAQSGQEITYTVVPYLEKDGEMFYGKFSYQGVQIAVP